jgi:hypothetical protein
MKMFSQHITDARVKARLSFLLICTLALSALPGLPSAASAKVGASDGARDQAQSVQIPLLAPGTAYRQTNLVSE